MARTMLSKKRDCKNRLPSSMLLLLTMARIAVALLVVLIPVTITPGCAQQQNPALSRLPKYPHRDRPPAADSEFKADRLTQDIDLPSVPPYSGKKIFLSGFRYPNDKTGERVGITYGVMEPESQVVDWYKDALKKYGWDIRNASESNLVAAAKGPKTFSVRITPSNSRDYRSMITLSLKESK